MIRYDVGYRPALLVGGNPTMKTPRLRRGGGIASSSNLVFYLYWYSYIVYFVCDSASEFEAMGSTSFLGSSCPNLLLVFLNFLLFLGTCIIFFIFFRKCWDFLWVFFILFLFFCTLFWVGLWPRKLVSLLSKKEKVLLDRGRNGF